MRVDLEEIIKVNAKLRERIKCEVGISTDIRQPSSIKMKQPRMLLVTAMESGSGKTFVLAGIAGALKRRGFKVGVIKVGGDIRDTVPALYLIKEPIRPYSSIKIGESGWRPLAEAIGEASKEHDFLLVEGAMSAFTGLLNDKVARPTSTAEVAAALGASTILVVGCDKEGVEGGLANSLNYISLLKNLGVNVTGVILNKVHTSYLSDEIKHTIKQAFSNSGVELLGFVPKMDVEGRGMIPEIEIKYEEFGAQAMQAAEQNINIDVLTRIAQAPKLTQVDYQAFMEKFKTLLTNYKLSASEGGKAQNCS